MSGEQGPQPSIEERVLIELGYEHCLDKPLGEGASIAGRNFLDAYGNSPKRQDTEDLLYGFADMSPADPEYTATKAYITRFLEPYFGPPKTD